MPCFKYPSKQIPSNKYYTLLILGEEECGKTTLLDIFTNYFWNINFFDQWRYKLVDENIRINSHEDEDENINTYYINYERENGDGEEINFKIIDTPGFKREHNPLNKLLIKQLEAFLKKVPELDNILIIMISTQPRISPIINYFLEKIIEIFGKVIEKRFALMVSFFFGNQEPIIFKTLKENYNFEYYFCFNNNDLYIRSNEVDEFDTLFWKLGNDNIKKLCKMILNNNYLSLSPKVTK